MYLWWSLCTLNLHAYQVRVTVGDSGLCCCTCVTYFKCWLTSLCVDSGILLFQSLGFSLDQTLAFKQHICKTAYLGLRRISSILHKKCLEVFFVSSFVLLRHDYRNCLLAGMPMYLIRNFNNLKKHCPSSLPVIKRDHVPLHLHAGFLSINESAINFIPFVSLLLLEQVLSILFTFWIYVPL